MEKKVKKKWKKGLTMGWNEKKWKKKWKIGLAMGWIEKKLKNSDKKKVKKWVWLRALTHDL